MNERRTVVARASVVGVIFILCTTSCREGRNALPSVPPGEGGGGSAAPLADAGPAVPAPPGVEGPSLGIVLLSKQSRYRLREGDERIPDELRDLRADLTASAKPAAAKKGPKAKSPSAEQRPPEAPPVDMTLRIVNRSKQRVEFWSDGDPVTLTLRLDGPGAVTAPMPVMHTLEMRPPKVVTLGPGETFDLPVTKLQFGERGDSTRAYWTRPGAYTIIPSLETAVRPAWPGTSVDGQGFGRVMLAGPPLRIHVDPQ